MNRIYQLWTRYGRLQPGQTMAEYALVITLVAAAGLLVWGTLGSNISKVINSIAGCI
jgi:Flp pilus assembly pilin Flp